ncbi:MAG: cation:proton antiporter subunit C [Cellulomonadaceae bacterium]|jgi:multicomponent Na+:H+ antiporter subunit C|nr:cation:proton antiporter subunit C [Cellulomonadaceae bacterium]
MFELSGEIVGLILFFIGLLGVIIRRNIMMTVLAVGIMNIAVVLFFVTLNAAPNYVPPMVGTEIVGTADPVPQALMITSVVIGVSVQAVLLVLVMNLFRQYGTLDWYEVQRLRAVEGEIPPTQKESPEQNQRLSIMLNR